MQGEENDYHYVVGAEPGTGFRGGRRLKPVSRYL